MHNFKELIIWQRSRKLVKDIYSLTSFFPETEKFGLTLQLRRSAISIPSNIAEGCGRSTDKQLNHFLEIAQGSLNELMTQILISYDLKFVDKETADVLLNEINELQKMTRTFIKNLKTKKSRI